MESRLFIIPKITISNLIFICDSLADRGTLYNRKLFGFIPMSLVTGLKGKSPDGSFTNGYTWSEDLITALVSEFTINKIKNKKHLTPCDIADAIVNQDVWIRWDVDNYYNLKNSLYVNFKGKNFVRDYSEGGLSSHNYKWAPTTNVSLFFTRMILSNLHEKRKKLINFDEINQLSKHYKEHTLIIEWSGANDLITLNKRPSIKEADKAIAGRMKNLEKLIEHGYCHFVLFNLPDLSLTPRFQARSEEERLNASSCSHYFNKKFKKKCKEMQKKYKHCTIDIFDIDTRFKDMYDHPEKYHLDKDKLTTPYTTSSDFKMLKNGTSPVDGYMFWDDVHITADAHAELAKQLFEQFRQSINFTAPSSLMKEPGKAKHNLRHSI
jgi:hypothetical protein